MAKVARPKPLAALAGVRTRVGRAVQEARTARGLTQTELAQALGVSQPSVSAWEVGRALPSSEVLIRIADELGLDLGKLADPLKRATPGPPASS